MWFVDLADRMRASTWSALLLGLLVFLLLSFLVVVPLFLGPVLLLTLAPYLAAMLSLRDAGRWRLALAAVLGAIEASVLLLTLMVLLNALIGPPYLASLEWMLVGMIYLSCVLFSVLGARSPER
ncbi:MAG TPA: hypothetical protein EYP43_00330 [Thermoplasmata archaeon]|nr:hypothetical protein [Thermoplasmata archaeon]